MESLNPELAFYGSKNECTSTNTVLSPIFEVSTGAVSHIQLAPFFNKDNIVKGSP